MTQVSGIREKNGSGGGFAVHAFEDSGYLFHELFIDSVTSTHNLRFLQKKALPPCLGGDLLYQAYIFMVEAMGIEPMSEMHAQRTSPSAVHVLKS